jgi:hypothetical protein
MRSTSSSPHRRLGITKPLRIFLPSNRQRARWCICDGETASSTSSS